MNKTIIFFILIIVQISTFSQSNWSKVVDNNNYNHSILSDNAMLGDSLIILGGFVSTNYCYGSIVSSYDINGKLRWEKFYGSNVLYSNNNFVYCVGYNIGTDDVVGDEFVNITKLDKNGNSIFNTKYLISRIDYRLNFNPNSIDFDNNKNILISTPNCIIKADSLGVVKSLKTYKLDITNVLSINSKQYLLNTHFGIFKSDTTGIIVDSIKFKSK